MEFDAAGTFIHGWGGPGQGYEWPNAEHGVTVDSKGFVWIAGRGKDDNQILKFTRDGKFVMQIGRSAQSKGNSDTTNVKDRKSTRLNSSHANLSLHDALPILSMAGADRDKATNGPTPSMA